MNKPTEGEIALKLITKMIAVLRDTGVFKDQHLMVLREQLELESDELGRHGEIADEALDLVGVITGLSPRPVGVIKAKTGLRLVRTADDTEA